MSKLKWTTVKRKVSDLLPYEHNPRQINEKQVEDLKKSFDKFDLVEIPAINTDNTIVAGHQRMKIMQLIGRGEEEIDVRVPNRQLTEAEFKEYNVRSNKNTAGWNYDVLANNFELSDLFAWGFKPDELVFDTEMEPEVDESDLKDALEKYQTNSIKQIVLYYPDEQFRKLQDQLKEIAEYLDLKDNSEVVAALIEEFSKNGNQAV